MGWGLAALLVAMAAAALVAVACLRAPDVPELEVRAHELNRTIMCPVCPGESIDQSQNPLAVQMRAMVTEKVSQGWSDGQIRAFFVERYGPVVLLEPPRQGFDWLAWLVPPGFVVVALAAVLVALRLMRGPDAPLATSGWVGVAEPDPPEEGGGGYERVIREAVGNAWDGPIMTVAAERQRKRKKEEPGDS